MADSFSTHVFIEFYYRKGLKFLNEHNSKLSQSELNESYGVFGGCYNIAKRITDRIKEEQIKNGESKVIKLTINNFSWINSFSVILYSDEYSDTCASYNPESEIILCNGKRKFSPLMLTVNVASENITVDIMHKLTHAYEDYNRRIKGKGSLKQKILDTGYYKNVLKGDYSQIDKYISYTIYYLTDFEVNAHLSQIKGELENTDRHFFNISEIVDFLKQTDIYQRYSVIKEYINYFSTIRDKDTQNHILYTVSDLSELTFRTYKDFIRYFHNKYNSLENKINRYIPKIAYEYLSFGNSFIQHKEQLPKLI